jgi:XTP/dITP diphosphohydrolase
MNKLFIGSKNKGKISEIKSVLKPLKLEILSFYDYDNIIDIEETGNTYHENALIKAKGFYNQVKIPVITDDSGLEVNVIDNQPGVYSARYAGINATDKDNIEKLLNTISNSNQQNKSARFICIIVYYDGQEEKYFEGICSGKITEFPRGDKGFGYDPVFIPDGYNITFAEMEETLKNKISHRAIALQKLRDFLKSL